MNKMQKKENRLTKKVIRDGAMFCASYFDSKGNLKTNYIFELEEGFKTFSYGYVRKIVRELIKEGKA